MMNEWGFAAAILSTIMAGWSLIVSKKKVKAEVESIAVDTSGKALESVHKQLAYLDEEVTRLRNLNREAAVLERKLTDEIRMLRRFIRENGLEPPV